jgi:hypothetical protein
MMSFILLIYIWPLQLLKGLSDKININFIMTTVRHVEDTRVCTSCNYAFREERGTSLIIGLSDGLCERGSETSGFIKAGNLLAS